MVGPLVVLLTKHYKIMNKNSMKEQIAEWAKAKEEKKKMAVTTITYAVTYNDEIFSLTITPKGKGFYDINCRIRKKDNIFHNRTLTLEDYFSYSISMSKAKSLVLMFAEHE